MDWIKFLDPEFRLTKLTPHTRDKVVTICSECGKRSVVIVNNLKKQVKKLGTHLCKSCSARRGTLRAKDKYLATMRKKYGADNPQQVKAIREKTEKTNLERYGTKTPIGSKMVRKKIKQSFLKKYGVANPFQAKEIVAKIKKTNVEKYGVDHLSKLPKNRNKLKNIMINKCGFGSPLKAKVLKDNNCKNYLEFCHKVVEFLETKKVPANSKEAESHFKVDGTTLIVALRHLNREDLVWDSYKVSHKETKILNFIKSFYSGKIIANDRTVVAPKEIDIYLPDLKIAIEFNGLIWHSEKFKSDKKYHYHKYKACYNKGIALYTFFESEFDNNQEALFKFIKNLIVKKQRVYARKCKFVNDSKRLREFIHENHLKKSVNSFYFIGLEYEGNLVMAASFSKHHRGLDQIVLNRVCFSDYCVIGGLEKLLKRFFKEYPQVNEIITWSDNSYSPFGTMYKNSGFELDEELEIDYFYTNTYGIASSKQSQSKNNTGCPKDTTESEWNKSRGLFRIWDCGKKRWKKKRSQKTPF